MKKIILILLVCCMHGVVVGQSYSIPQYNNLDTQSTDTKLEKIIARNKDKFSLSNEDVILFNNLKSLKKESIKVANKADDKTLKDSVANVIFTEIDEKKYIKFQTTYLTTSLSEVRNRRDFDLILKENKEFISENFTEEDYKLINEVREALTIDYTKLNFLSKEKRPKTFYIWNSENYDVTMFNEYFSGNKTFNAISNISVQTFLEDTYINSQIISFYFNYIKLSLSGSLKATNNSQNDSDKIKENLTNILHNNGSLNLNFTLPIIYNRDRKEHIHYGLFAETSVGLTPNFETTESAYFSNDLLVTNQVGLNFKFDISSNENELNKKARFIVEIPVNYIYGNKKSYELLNITDNSSIRIKIGAVLGDKLNFSISGPLYSTNDLIKRTPFLFALNFSPEQILK